jgi:NAD(P)H dehydrogenase (quinone)
MISTDTTLMNGATTMTNVAVIVHSLAGSTMSLANAASEGAREVDGADIRLRRVADLMPDEEIAANPRFGTLFTERVASTPIATSEDLTWADAIVLGCGTRFGGMSSSMRRFLEQAAPLWMSNALVGKVGAVFSAASTPHGGMEQTVHDLITALMHFGVLIVPPGYGDPVFQQAASPYGAVAQAGGISGRMPTDADLAAARFSGRQVTMVAKRLAAVPVGA